MKEKLLKALKLVYSLENYYCRDSSDETRMEDFAELKELLGELLVYYPETPDPSHWYTYGVPLNSTADYKEQDQKPKKSSKKK